MAYKKFYVVIIFKIIILSALSGFFFYALANSLNTALVIIAGILFLFQIFSLINYINKVNRILENFFNFQIAGDHTSIYSKSWKKDEFKSLNQSFDLINQKLKKAKTDYEIQNKYFETIVNHIGVGLMSFDNEGNIELFNETAKKIFNLGIAKHIEKLNYCKTDFSDELLEMKPSEPKIFTVLINGEQKQLLAKLTTFKTNNTNLSLVSFQNIKSELEQNEIESWQKLIRVLTHEIVNSISPITSLTNSLIRIFKKNEGVEIVSPENLDSAVIEKVIKGLEIIEERGNGLMHFVEKYRSLTLLPRPEFRQINAKDFLEKTNHLFENVFSENNIKTRIEAADDLVIRADSKLLEQVLINLIQNAVEATKNTIDPEIEILSYSLNGNTFFEINDNGSGIPEEVVENIFIPFFTTKEKGSGIGLSLSRQIMLMHNGTISLKESLNTGTSFILKFRN
ncbi:MAG: hypothetical protein HXX09_03035 [Bacteroidetes bacterium]|nr:hypothetical protein [Bacteroidota bacterium]